MVTGAERHHFRRLEAAFREAETDDEPSSAGQGRRIDDANRRRAERGIPPLRDEPEDPPELALYRRARALGRSRRRG